LNTVLVLPEGDNLESSLLSIIHEALLFIDKHIRAHHISASVLALGEAPRTGMSHNICYLTSARFTVDTRS